ncbi:unnamed protein product, partial [Musa hybrid cultivar]
MHVSCSWMDGHPASWWWSNSKAVSPRWRSPPFVRGSKSRVWPSRTYKRVRRRKKHVLGNHKMGMSTSRSVQKSPRSMWNALIREQ